MPDEWNATSIMMLYKTLDDAGYAPMRAMIEKILQLPLRRRQASGSEREFFALGAFLIQPGDLRDGRH